jgi:DNA repair protein RadC
MSKEKQEPSEKTYTAITGWAEDDRPREKLLHKGRLALSDAELIAILLGSGSRGESAVTLAQRILRSADNNLIELGKKSVKELMNFKGMGEAKALTLMAALELGRRRQLSDVHERPRVHTSLDCYRAIASYINDLKHEEFWLILLSRNNEIIDRKLMSSGGSAGTVVDVKLILKAVLESGAAAFIAAHNHPSGSLTPSDSDKSVTNKLLGAANLMDIQFLDHLIISDRGYYSFRDHNLM